VRHVLLFVAHRVFRDRQIAKTEFTRLSEIAQSGTRRVPPRSIADSVVMIGW
jgi:hypothetical protein